MRERGKIFRAFVSFGNLKKDAFAIPRNVKAAAEKGSALSCIPFFAVLQITVFRVPEQQIFDSQGLGQFTGVFCSAVVLFIWFKTLPLFIEAKGLMEHPVSAFEKAEEKVRTGFVAGKGNFHTLFCKAEKSGLFCLGGLNIQKSKLVV